MSNNNQITQTHYFRPLHYSNPLLPSQTLEIGTGDLSTSLLKPPSTFQTHSMNILPPANCTMPHITPLPLSMSAIPVCPPDNPISAPVVKRKRKTIRIPRKPPLDSTEHQIARLERKLAIYQASIEEAGCVELTLDDLLYQDNALLRLDRLERKAADIWEKICELKGKSDRIMVMSDVLKNVNCTPYPSINQRIERFFKRNILDLPDILDVSDMISKVSDKEGLSLCKAEILRLSKQVLLYVGNLMSDRRRADLYEVLKSRTESDELAIGPDPLLLDPVFKARLEENDVAFKTRLKETLGLFCEKQDELAVNGETDPIADPISDNTKEDNHLCDLEDSPLNSPSYISNETPVADSVSHSSDTDTPVLPIYTHSTTDTFHSTAPISKKSTPHNSTPALPMDTHSSTETFHCDAVFSKNSTSHNNTPALPIDTISTANSTFHHTTLISKKSKSHNTITTFHSPTYISMKSTPLDTIPVKRIKLDQRDDSPIVISSDED